MKIRVIFSVKMTFRRGASCACYVGIFYLFYLINIGDTQLLINVKNQVKAELLYYHKIGLSCHGYDKHSILFSFWDYMFNLHLDFV